MEVAEKAPPMTVNKQRNHAHPKLSGGCQVPPPYVPALAYLHHRHQHGIMKGGASGIMSIDSTLTCQERLLTYLTVAQ